MTFTTKQKVIFVVAYTAAAVAVGRFSLPAKIVTEIKTVEVEKKTVDKKEDLNTHKKIKRKTVEKTKPDGEKTTTTVEVDEDVVNSITDNKTTDSKEKTTDDKKEVTYATSKVTISALAGANIFNVGNSGVNPLVYGINISKPILGPLTLNAFGFNSGLVGFGLGLTF